MERITTRIKLALVDAGCERCDSLRRDPYGWHRLPLHAVQCERTDGIPSTERLDTALTLIEQSVQGHDARDFLQKSQSQCLMLVSQDHGYGRAESGCRWQAKRGWQRRGICIIGACVCGNRVSVAIARRYVSGCGLTSAECRRRVKIE